MKLAEIHRYDTAVALIRRGLRISIVRHITGIHPKTLRSLHREIHGRGPTAGPMPSTRGILSAPSAQAMASVFAACYRSVGGAGIYDRIDIAALLLAHDLYRELVEVLISDGSQVKPLDINQAWIIARDIRTGAVYFRDCRACVVRYLCAADTHAPPGCPICALKRRDKEVR